MIVETEAYIGPEDHASYTFGGRRTDANEPMYMAAGTCFIRPIYGMIMVAPFLYVLLNQPMNPLIK
ncbi:DNA-3-methyladenine glycosylase-like protein [Euroglyphus maynei]|uniref:DNA-3-methyladenine glycosylase II n=1 Tax=Euroglyphus maynei TaxID=6958 RepID=A0A1Y3BV19_EURMA|nr:DNA-3-methyladenine glycosylase-like protein [Euroglyphus maynei]